MFDWLTSLPRPNGIVEIACHDDFDRFTQAYLQVRQQEGRLYNDELLRQLPHPPPLHPLAPEWRARAESAHRLIQHLKQQTTATATLRVLEIGCGNGWLTHQIAATVTSSAVVGLDINRHELEQAARVFKPAPNLAFVFGEARQLAAHTPAYFDIIILASAVQYFANLPNQVRHWQNLLRPNGQIHILDSPFYTKKTLPKAKLASRQYYQRLGVPELAQHYHAHDITSWLQFQPRLMYDPSALKNRLRRRLGLGAYSPFQWWCLHV